MIAKNAVARTHKDIMLKLKQLRAQYDGVTITERTTYTIEEWMNKWLEEYKKPFIRSGTYDGYKQALKHINRVLGKKKLNTLKTEEIQRFYNNLHTSGRKQYVEKRSKQLSASYVRKIHLVLNEALEYAATDNLIPSNPAESTVLPKIERQEKKVMLEEELDRFIDVIDEIPEWRDFFYLEIMTGLRRGEICGLMWDDLDEYMGTLCIQRSISYKNKELVIGEPKTDEGKRVIVLPDSALEMLIERKRLSVSKWIFHKSINPELPTSPTYAYQKLQEILKTAGIERMRFHDLRHTFATHAARNGVDPKTLAGLLGHTNASFTLDTYAHVTSDMQKHASNVVERFLDDILGDESGLTNDLIL